LLAGCDDEKYNNVAVVVAVAGATLTLAVTATAMAGVGPGSLGLCSGAGTPSGAWPIRGDITGRLSSLDASIFLELSCRETIN